MVTQFPNYYAIAKEGSLTSTTEFIDFCDKVGIAYEEDFPDKNLLNRSMVDSCFKVPEPIFDYNILKRIIFEKLRNLRSLNVILDSCCTGIRKKANLFEVRIGDKFKEYDVVINATYSSINQINSMLGLKLNRLRFEDVFIPYFLYPCDKFGLTVMDGPFCSVMPKGNNKNEFLLYHVQHSVKSKQIGELIELKKQDITNADFEKIFQDSKRFYPFLKDATQFGYWQTTRAVYDNTQDARVTELYEYPTLDNYFTVLSGKITTCIKLASKLKNIIKSK